MDEESVMCVRFSNTELLATGYKDGTLLIKSATNDAELKY